jgi:DNA-binding response OmpR family regulator
MLPDGQGIDFLKEMRIDYPQIPIIMLTAKTELIDKVLGLESGANDYITKPFEPRELIARIRVQLRENKNNVEKEIKLIEVHTLKIDLEKRDVTFNEKMLELTKMEYDLLRLLAESPGRVFSREEILNKVWGFENYPSTRTVDTHVLQLRQKISEDIIETMRGIGYRLKPL